MPKNTLKPTAYQTFRIEFAPDAAGHDTDFESVLERSRKLEDKGRFEEACNLRFNTFQELVELIPDEGDITLDWDDETSQAAIVLGYSSAIDLFLIADWEMCAAALEMILELDPEDHLEASVILAYTYIAMGEYESFDEVLNDVNDSSADKAILTLWSEERRTGRLPQGEVIRLKRNFAPYYREFIAASHPVDEAYVKDIGSEHPSKEALARELWIQTEHLWTRFFPDFIEKLKQA
ncbi:MAG: tetratricopeptide repeat protein [Tidjanibacter sp.]|nr:tetratricopeptide repeat protein [Tidjanibacter sp.]